MLKKSQWLSIWVFSIILSVAVSIIVFVKEYNDNDDVFISLIYSAIPLIFTAGIIVTISLGGSNKIDIITPLRKILRLFLKLLFFAVICTAIGIGLKIPLDIGLIVYEKYTFNENLSKSKFAMKYTSDEKWGKENLQFSNKSFNGGMIQFDVYNRSQFPLQCIYMKFVSLNEKKDTIYSEVIAIDGKFNQQKSEKVTYNYLPDLPDSVLLSWCMNCRQDVVPLGGKISSDYLNNVNFKNLESLLK